jgi:hypothetical protein
MADLLRRLHVAHGLLRRGLAREYRKEMRVIRVVSCACVASLPWAAPGRTLKARIPASITGPRRAPARRELRYVFIAASFPCTCDHLRRLAAAHRPAPAPTTSGVVSRVRSIVPILQCGDGLGPQW